METMRTKFESEIWARMSRRDKLGRSVLTYSTAIHYYYFTPGARGLEASTFWAQRSPLPLEQELLPMQWFVGLFIIRQESF